MLPEMRSVEEVRLMAEVEKASQLNFKRGNEAAIAWNRAKVRSDPKLIRASVRAAEAHAAHNEAIVALNNYRRRQREEKNSKRFE